MTELVVSSRTGCDASGHRCGLEATTGRPSCEVPYETGKQAGKIDDRLLIEDWLVSDALERFRGCRNLNYRVSERTFDLVWQRCRLPIHRSPGRAPSFAMNGGRHWLWVSLDAEVADGEFTVEPMDASPYASAVGPFPIDGAATRSPP